MFCKPTSSFFESFGSGIEGARRVDDCIVIDIIDGSQVHRDCPSYCHHNLAALLLATRVTALIVTL